MKTPLHSILLNNHSIKWISHVKGSLCGSLVHKLAIYTALEMAYPFYYLCLGALNDQKFGSLNLSNVLGVRPKEWKIIEAREFYKLSIVRVNTIKSFEKHIKDNAKEVPIMHDFLVKFSWLLDPRLLNFKDEITYSELLREHFKDDALPDESDRRIDFLCHHFGDSFFIIELKRPEKVISNKELDQALSYVSFIRSKLGNEYGRNIYCYIIGKKLADTEELKLKADSYSQSGTVYFKPYEALLSATRNYHQEFIDRYEEMEKKNNADKETMAN